MRSCSCTAAGQLQNAAYIDMAGPHSAGGLYSTGKDLYKWDQALYTGAVTGGATNLLPECSP
jgi:CubicO group peptidase (beta-lactamase class C family)